MNSHSLRHAIQERSDTNTALHGRLNDGEREEDQRRLGRGQLRERGMTLGGGHGMRQGLLQPIEKNANYL